MIGDGLPMRASEHALSQCVLVLAAKNIPFRLVRQGGRGLLYVPPLLEKAAREEIAAYAAEPSARSVFDEPAPKHRLYPLIVFFVFLAGWHYLCAEHAEWSRLGLLDVYRVRVSHEWYRLVTALSLHADAVHLVGNIAAGGFFVALLCRRVGVGTGLLLTVIGGIAGNAWNVLYRPLNFSSLGFSSAVFAAVGIISGIQAVSEGLHERRKAVLPLGAGAGLLAMLGTEGPRTDYAAHLFGLGSGLLLGMLWRRANLRGAASARVQTLAALVVCVLFSAAWIAALNQPFTD
jgi:membrane associated rhomboid family serine protease